MKTHKTKQAALKAARDHLGDDAIEGIDFNLNNTGAGWSYAEIPAGNDAAAKTKAAKAPQKVAVLTDEKNGVLTDMTVAEATAGGYGKFKDGTGSEVWVKPDSKLLVDGVLFPNKTRASDARAAKASAATKADPKPKAPKAEGPSKGDIIVKMLSAAGGATSKEMEDAVNWQPHSVRGFLSTLRSKGHQIEGKKPSPSEPTVYRIVKKPAVVGDVV